MVFYIYLSYIFPKQELVLVFACEHHEPKTPLPFFFCDHLHKNDACPEQLESVGK